jgi:hypothetical protein
MSRSIDPNICTNVPSSQNLKLHLQLKQINTKLVCGLPSIPRASGQTQQGSTDMGIIGNETANPLPKVGSECPLIGPEPS